MAESTNLAESADLYSDIYADIDTQPRLPSEFALQQSLDTAVATRMALEAQLEELQAAFAHRKGEVEGLARLASQIMRTARLEISRKHAQIEKMAIDLVAKRIDEGACGLGVEKGPAPFAREHAGLRRQHYLDGSRGRARVVDA